MWNCKGAKIAATVGEIKRLWKVHNPNFLFLTKTKADENQIKILARKLKFNNMDTIPAIGNAGGLAMFWIDNLDLYIDTKDKYFFHCIINVTNGQPRRLTVIQRPPYAAEKI